MVAILRNLYKLYRFSPKAQRWACCYSQVHSREMVQQYLLSQNISGKEGACVDFPKVEGVGGVGGGEADIRPSPNPVHCNIYPQWLDYITNSSSRTLREKTNPVTLSSLLWRAEDDL